MENNKRNTKLVVFIVIALFILLAPVIMNFVGTSEQSTPPSETSKPSTPSSDTSRSSTPSSSTSRPSCGHDSCAELGPFYCMGKNDTCNNRTGCAYVFYCSSCR